MVDDELLETGKEADSGKGLAILEVFVYIEGAQKGFQQVGTILDLQFLFGHGEKGVLGDAQVVANHGLSPVVDQ